jgi:hypothetical protein
LEQLGLQWRNHLGGARPTHLPKWLLMRVLAYRIQAVAHGDLEKSALRSISATGDEEPSSAGPHPFALRFATTRDGAKLQPRRPAGARMGRPRREGDGARERLCLERLDLSKPVASRQGDHRRELERAPLLRTEGGG